MNYQQKYIKYKNKYLYLKNIISIGGVGEASEVEKANTVDEISEVVKANTVDEISEPSDINNNIKIIESISDPDNLIRKNAGVINFVYLDVDLGYIVKIPKLGGGAPANLITTDKISTDIIIKELSSIEEINSYILSLKYDSSILEKLKNNIVNYLESVKVTNRLSTFLKFEGIIIYKNIKYGEELPLIVNAFEYLDEVQDLDRQIVVLNREELKENMINIILDFQTFNSSGYSHRDLQKNCRNIVKYRNKNGEIKLKVVDIDNPVQFDNELDKLFDTIFTDYLSLIECLIRYKLLTEDDKEKILSHIDIITFIKSLILKLTIFDKTRYLPSNNYTKYTIILDNWENDRISGPFSTDKKIIISIKPDIGRLNKIINIEYNNIGNRYYETMIDLTTNKEIIKQFIITIYDILLSQLHSNV